MFCLNFVTLQYTTKLYIDICIVYTHFTDYKTGWSRIGWRARENSRRRQSFFYDWLTDRKYCGNQVEREHRKNLNNMDRGMKSIKNRHGCHLYYTQYFRTGQVNTIFSEGKLLEKRLFGAPAVSTASSASIVFRSNRFRVAVRECVYR